MRHCSICWQECKEISRYCLKCANLLIKNRNKASNLQKKDWRKHCPLCLSAIDKKEVFCRSCTKRLKKPKLVLSAKVQRMTKKDEIKLDYTYIIKDPRFFRKHKKDYVEYKIIELEMRTWHIFTQNLEIFYKEWLPKRNRFQGKEKYFQEYLVPIIRKQYERWRLNALWFKVDVAVEMILQEWKKKADGTK